MRLPQHAGDCEPLSSPRSTNMLSRVFVISPGSHCAAEVALFMLLPYRHLLSHSCKKPSGLPSD